MATVATIIERLQQFYKPTDELIVAWWDKKFVSNVLDIETTEDQWVELVETYENGDEGLSEALSAELQYIIKTHLLWKEDN